MKKLALGAFLLGLFGMCAAVNAADKDDPTGTWTIRSKIGKKAYDQTLKIENKDGTVTGTITSGNKVTKIADGKFKDGELTFNLTVEAKGVKVTTKYAGKVTGDAIKGTSTTEYDGKEYKSDFEGKREKEKK